MKTVLYLNNVAVMGGAEQSLLALVESVRKSGYRPIVVLGSDGPLFSRLNDVGIQTYVFPLDFCHTTNPLPFVRSVGYLKHIIKKEDVRLVHSNTLWDNQYGTVAARISRVPHILHVRGFSRCQCSWKSFYGLGNVAICNSRHTRDEFVNSTGFRKKVEVVYNGVDTDKFRPDDNKRMTARSGYGFTRSDFVMGMAGRLTEEKGQLTLLKMLLPLLKSNKHYKVVISGDTNIHTDDYRKRLELFINDSALGEQVTVAGFVDDMPTFYNALDLFLLPSIREPFGRVLIEAMATEISVIASRVGGVPEVVKDGEVGYLVEAADASAWRTRVEDLALDKPLRTALGSAGRRHAMANFSLAASVAGVCKLYDEIVG